MDAVQDGRRRRLKRLEELSEAGRTEVNGAYILNVHEAHSSNRSRVEALLGNVDSASFDRICTSFKSFSAKLRKDESNCLKHGSEQKRKEFYMRKFDCAAVFGDSSLYFARKPICDAFPSTSRVDVAELISKGLNNFARVCISPPSIPISPVSGSSTRRLSRIRGLNEAKRKEISNLRQRVRIWKFEAANLKRENMRSRLQCNGFARKERDRMRRDLEGLEEENRSLRETVEELRSRNVVVTKENGKFTSEFHHLLIQLIALGIPDSKVCEVIRVTTAFVNCSLSAYPSLSTIRNDAIALLSLAVQQAKEVLDGVTGGNDLTLISDETTKRRSKLQTYLLNVSRDERGSKVFCLGIPEVHVKTASESIEAFSRRVNRIELVCSGTVTGELLNRLVSSISACMSDRASTQLKFNRLLENFKREILASLMDDWDRLTASEKDALAVVHTLYCQLHIAASITDVFMGEMGKMEGKSGDECTLLWVLRTFASHFSDRGSGKFMQLSKWLVFLDDKGVDKVHCILPSFDGQRFCIAFAIAARIYFLRELLIEYISRFCTENDTLTKAKDALSSPLLTAQLKCASLVDSFISAPLIRLSEHTKHVCETSTYVGEMIGYLSTCESTPARMLSLTPPSITVGDQSLVFDLNSLYLKSTVASPLTVDDSKCISAACSEIRMFLEVQYVDFLPGGRYHSPSQSLVDSLRNAPSTSRAAERVFGMVDFLFVKSPNCRMLRREGVVMSKMNGTIQWLADMPLEVQAQVVGKALRMRKKLATASAEEKVILAGKIREDLLEKEEEAKKKQQRAFEKQSEIATVIATENGGYWRTVEAMESALDGIRTKTEKIRALTYQIRYRKITLKQPPPRPGIFVIKPNGVDVTVDRLKGALKELIRADLAASAGKRSAPDWKGRRVERLVRTMTGSYTLIEGIVQGIEEIGGVLYVTFEYEDCPPDTILVEEFEEELESENAKFLGKRTRK